MPAQHLIPNWPERDATIRNHQIFTDRIFTRNVLPPVLNALGLSLRDLRKSMKPQPHEISEKCRTSPNE